MATRTVTRYLMVLVGLLALAGCGRSEEPAPTQIPAPTGVAAGDVPPGDGPAAVPADGTPGGGTPGVAADADVTSGCWTADQRVPGAVESVGYQQWSAPPATVIDPSKRYYATLETSLGVVEVELLPNEAPLSVANFVCLARAGYYDGTVFHRIVPGFVVQGGDPTGSGTGGPGYQFADEPVVRPYETGSLAMANSGPNTNGSQFFLVLEGGADGLNQQVQAGTIYNHFGRVNLGLEIVEQIGLRDTSDPAQEPVTLERVTIAEE